MRRRGITARRPSRAATSRWTRPTQCFVGFPSDPGYQFGVLVRRRTCCSASIRYVNPSQDLAYGDSLVSITGNPTDPDLVRRATTRSTAASTASRQPTSASRCPRTSPRASCRRRTSRRPRRRAAAACCRRPPSWSSGVIRRSRTSTGSRAARRPPGIRCHRKTWWPSTSRRTPKSPTFTSAPFPAATQRVTVASSAFPLTTSSGWLFLNLNTVVAGGGIGLTDPAAAQAWVTVLNRVQQGPNGGRYDVGYRAIAARLGAQHLARTSSFRNHQPFRTTTMRGIMRARRILLTLTAITGLVIAAAPALAQFPVAADGRPINRRRRCCCPISKSTWPIRPGRTPTSRSTTPRPRRCSRTSRSGARCTSRSTRSTST